MANLEHKLDTQLLLRKNRPELTEAGNRLFSFTQAVIKQELHALDDIRQIKSGALSTLSLGMSSMFNRFYGKEMLLEFCERNPLTRLKLDLAPGRELIYGVDEDRWELGIGPFQTRMPGHFVTTPFFDEKLNGTLHRLARLIAERRRSALHRARRSRHPPSGTCMTRTVRGWPG